MEHRAIQLIWTLAALAVLAACREKGPEIAASAGVAAGHAQRGNLWPILLQHCLRAPACDPMSDFGEGAGQSSGVAGQTLWFAETKDAVSEGGWDDGARITLSFNGPASAGGAAGRPLTLEEIPSNLRAGKDRATWVSVEFRQPGEKMEPYVLAVRSAHLALRVPGLSAAKSQQDIASATGDYIAGLKWPGDGSEATGARLQLSARGQVILTGYSIGLASGAKIDNADAVKRGYAPWVFHLSRTIRDEPAPGLLAALRRGEALALKITDPAGDVMLDDLAATDGFELALEQAVSALADPSIAEPLTLRCAPFAGVENGLWDDVWRTKKATPAQHACDPRTAPQRMQVAIKADPANDARLRQLRDAAERKAGGAASPSAQGEPRP